MDNSAQFGMDNHFGLNFGGPSIHTFRALPSLLGEDKAGTQRGILVLHNSKRDFDFAAGAGDVLGAICGCCGGN
jgi:hypothetical protein